MKIKRFWNIQSSDSMSWLVWFINDFSFEERAGGGGGQVRPLTTLTLRHLKILPSCVLTITMTLFGL